MSADSPDFRTILKYAGGGMGAALALYFTLDRLVEVNHVGLVQRLGFPWSSLPIWVAVGAVIGLVHGVRMDLRMRRHERGFATGPELRPLSDPDPGPELVAADGGGPWEHDPTVREMPLLRVIDRPAGRTQTHQFSHRMTGDHRGRPIEVFDLATEVRTTYGDAPSSRTLRRTVVLLPAFELPAFEVRSRTVRRRFLRGFGLGGLDFDPGGVDTLDDAEAIATFVKAHDVGLHDVFLAAGPDRDAGEVPSPDGGAEAEA